MARFGPKAFEQAAGFLRVRGGENPLDDTAVHPERYAALEALASRLGKGLAELARPRSRARARGGGARRKSWAPSPGRTSSPSSSGPGGTPGRRFVPFAFREDVQKLEDLKPGMACPGIVSNVTNFGAFVDIGVHHDGLVHVSQLGARFVKDPKAVLKPGDRVQVRVLKVDLDKKQISLTLRPAPERKPASARKAAPPRKPAPERRAREKAGRPRLARGEGRGRGAPRAPERPRRPAPARRAARLRPGPPRRRRPTVVSGPARSGRPRPADRPAKPPADRRPEPRRQVFNNPFAVLAGLKVPPKGDKS